MGPKLIQRIILIGNTEIITKRFGKYEIISVQYYIRR